MTTKILRSLGYRLMKDDIWGKPMAYHLFTYRINTKEWRNSFIGGNGKVVVWNSDILSEEESKELKESIQYIERYTRTDLGSLETDTSFTTQDEIINDLLNG